MKQTISKQPETTNTKQADLPEEIDRREALVKLGKYAIYTSPVMTTIITNRNAAASPM